MKRLHGYFANIRIANKIILPFLVVLFGVIVAISFLVSHLFADYISTVAESQLEDDRGSTDLLVQSWNDCVRNGLLNLTVDDDLLAGIQAGNLTAAGLESVAGRYELDFSEVSTEDGEVLGGLSLLETEDLEGDGDPELVQTEEGWGVRYSKAVDLPSGSRAVVSAGRLFSNGFLQRLPLVAGEGTSVAFAVGSEIIATSADLDAGSRCNGCHDRERVTLAASSETAGDPFPGNLVPDSTEMPDGRYKMLHAPFRIGDSVAGTYTLLLRMDSIETAQGHVRELIYGVGGLLLLLFAGVGTVISRSITKPLTKLADISEDIAAGNLSLEIEEAGQDEVGKLSKSMATMTASLSSQLKELGLLHQVSLTVNSSLELDYVLETLLESAIKVLGADGGSIMLLTRDASALEVKVARGRKAPDIIDQTVDLQSESAAAWVVRNRRPLLLPDDGEEIGRPMITRSDIASSVIVPIETRDSLLGVLNLNILEADGRAFDRNTITFARTLGHHTGISIDKARHHQEVNGLYTGLMQALARTIDAKDPYTFGHSEMVARYTGLIGRAMGLDESSLRGLETSAYLHDVGKIGVRDAVLTKPGRLTPIERRVVETHPLVGAQILENIVFPWPVVEAVRHHHERWDGGGYPYGLAGEDIPLEARILAVADSFDAMTSTRPYRAGRDVDEALEELTRCSGTQFDPRVISVFLDIEGQVRTSLRGGRQEFPESHTASMVAL